MIGGHFAFPELPHAIGQFMFWAGVAGLVLFALAYCGVFDRFVWLQKWLGERKAKRDVGVSEAVAYVSFREWGKRFIDAAGSSDVDAVASLREFQQAALDGDVSIWGKHPPSEIFDLIQAGFWSRHQIEWFGLLKGNPTTEPTISASDGGNAPESLMTSRQQVEATWPKKRARLKFRAPWALTRG